MPELPEVETVARELAGEIVGRKVVAFEVLDPRLDINAAAFPLGAKVLDVFRRGKQVVISFSYSRSKQLFVAIHLRMTGRLIWIPGRGRPLDNHLRARFVLQGGQLSFIDVRRFGTIALYQNLADIPLPGLDPISPEFTLSRFEQLLQGSKQEVRVWLLRQDRLVGIGNIYASEILANSGIAPKRKVQSLNKNERKRLHQSVKSVLKKAIKHCGTTFSDFQNSRGESGSFQRYLKVYGREGLPCKKCKTPIHRIVQAQRRGFYCPQCQR